MPPTPLTLVYCDQDDVEAILSAEGVLGRFDDENEGVLNVQELTWLNQNISWATSRINFFLQSRYDANDLATSFLVNDWCSIMAAFKFSGRRGNPVPGSLKDSNTAALEDLKMVHSGEYNLPDIGLRTAAWPAHSNLRVSLYPSLRKLRVERPISERTPTRAPFRQVRDRSCDFIQEEC